QKLTIKPGKDQEPIEVAADEKKHLLQVTKDGFETFTEKFKIAAAKATRVAVHLERGKRVGATSPPSGASRIQTVSGWQPLFDGKSLAGWTGDANVFEVDAPGNLAAKGDRGLLYTDKDFGDFELEAEFSIAQGGNNGIVVRTPGVGNPAMAGLEINVIDDAGYAGLADIQRCGSVWNVSPGQAGRCAWA